MRRAGEQAARAWLTASTRVAQALTETPAAAQPGRHNPSQGAGLPKRLQAGAGAGTLTTDGSLTLSAQPAQQARRLGLAALRTQALQRASHSQAAGASAAIAAELSKLDAVFAGDASAGGTTAAREAIDQACWAILDMQAQSPQDRLALNDARAAALAFMGDARQLTDALISGEAHSMASLAEVMNIDCDLDDLRSPPPGLETCKLSGDESLALSLYSVRSELKWTANANQVFRAVNTAMRMDVPEAKNKLRFLIDPLVSGMAKLPAANGQTVYRGLNVANMDDTEALQAQQQQFADAKEVSLPAPSPASCRAAYPGNVVFIMKSAEKNSQLRDTSEFNYVSEQEERTFLPGTRFRVASTQLATVPKKYGLYDAIVASSNRTWSERVGKPLLWVALEEVPADEPASAQGEKTHP
jgi:hypothetical protein